MLQNYAKSNEKIVLLYEKDRKNFGQDWCVAYFDVIAKYFH
jgi:hypothetical protein